MHAVEGIDAEDYVYALGDITHPTNIINFSKISNGRIRIYLKDKTIADHITKTYKTIKIQNQDVRIRPLSIKSKRLVISGACPEMPNELIINELKRLGLNPTSNLNFLRAGLKRPNFEHILGAKRCIYVSSDPDQDIPIPDSTLIMFEDTFNRIFISDDSIFCTYCKKHGHQIEKCRTKIEMEQNQMEAHTNETNTDETTTTLDKNIKKFFESRIISQTNSQNTTLTTETPTATSTSKVAKRPLTLRNTTDDDLSETDISNSDQIEIDPTSSESDDPFEKIKPKKKNKKSKKKRSQSPTLSSQNRVTVTLEAEDELKQKMLDNPANVTLSFETLDELLENTQNVKNPIVIIKEYVADPAELITTLDTLYPTLKTSKYKNRFTRLRNKILKALETTTNE